MTAKKSTAIGPLTDVVVVDFSRMLPGAVLARQLIDLGARLIKVEDPAGGDPMRAAPPMVGGVGAGFATLLRGSESVCLDLRSESGAIAARRLAASADVVIESFR
ncbi:MAG: CoA transferase, partial [Acidobacteria bacterium]|nr:CoA transferase [Acidobacteriota bacterium]